MKQKAWELCARGWTQGAGARDAEGESVFVNEEVAVCWCAIGAINNVYGTDQILDMEEKLANHIRKYEDPQGIFNGASTSDDGVITAWNDAANRTQSEVVGVLRRLDI